MDNLNCSLWYHNLGISVLRTERLKFKSIIREQLSNSLLSRKTRSQLMIPQCKCWQNFLSLSKWILFTWKIDEQLRKGRLNIQIIEGSLETWKMDQLESKWIWTSEQRILMVTMYWELDGHSLGWSSYFHSWRAPMQNHCKVEAML